MQVITVASIAVPIPTVTRDSLPSVLRGIAGRVYQAWLDHRPSRGNANRMLNVRVNGQDVEQCGIYKVNDRFVSVGYDHVAESRIPNIIYERLLSSMILPHAVEIRITRLGPAASQGAPTYPPVDFPLSNIPYGHNLLTDNTSVDNLHTTEPVHPDTATYLTTEAAGGRITGIHEHASMLRYLEGPTHRSPYTGTPFVQANVRRLAAEAVRLHYERT